MSSGSSKKMTPKVEDDVSDDKITFTEAEMRKYTRYFRKIARLAKLKKHALANILDRVANIWEWQAEVKCYHFQKGFIHYLLRYEVPCKKLAAEYIKQKRGPPPPQMTDGQAEDDMKIEAQY